ncbi:MAG TPA: DUF2071 domain-containing protein [Chthoniobacterales bacterium]|nr:DUF2071 domain-containing protein [Chthoniobacterales bacterium]
MHQRWENLLFLHWRVPQDRIQETLPPGLTVDTFNGDAYLGVVPFFMRNVRLIGTPALPWWSFFQELNVRTYVFDHGGTPGVWFYSLDCNRAWAAGGARVLGALPYFLAEMNAQRGDCIEYSCRRRGTSAVARFCYRATSEERDTAPESLEFFFLERYYLFAYRRAMRSLLRSQVAHTPYRFRDVDLTEWALNPLQLAGFKEIESAPDHVCVVDGLNVNIFGQERVL